MRVFKLIKHIIPYKRGKDTEVRIQVFFNDKCNEGKMHGYREALKLFEHELIRKGIRAEVFIEFYKGENPAKQQGFKFTPQYRRKY